MEFAQRDDAEKKRLEEVEKTNLAEIQSLQVRVITYTHTHTHTHQCISWQLSCTVKSSKSVCLSQFLSLHGKGISQLSKILKCFAENLDETKHRNYIKTLQTVSV